MKCLSISQPFAELVISGKKTIELRSWNTNFRGKFLVHAPIKIRILDCKRLKIDAKKLAAGAIVGTAQIYEVKKYSSASQVRADSKKHLASRKFGDRRYGFAIKNAKKFRIPIPCKGKLGFFEVTLPKTKKSQTDDEIKSDLFDEEYRYQWINRH